MDQDYIFYDAMLYGTDRTGNKLCFDVRFGYISEPNFRKRIDAENRRNYLAWNRSQRNGLWNEYTPDQFDTLLEQSVEESEHRI